MSDTTSTRATPLSASNASVGAVVAAVTTPAKRKPGRPAGSGSKTAKTPGVHKGPGRPRKSVVVPAATLTGTERHLLALSYLIVAVTAVSLLLQVIR